MAAPPFPFAIDTFPPGLPLYFLTHAHADHLRGLTPSFRGRVITTRTTALVAAHRTSCAPTIFTVLSYRTPTRLALPSASLTVTLLPAEHCPGACMFLLHGPFGRVLHTGDFRATPHVMRAVQPLARSVDLLILDATYCHPDFDFPSPRQAANRLLAFVDRTRAEAPDADILIGADTFGKEELFAVVAKHTKKPVFLEKERYDLLHRINPVFAKAHFAPFPYTCPRLTSTTTTTTTTTVAPLHTPQARCAGIYVLQRWKLSSKRLAAWHDRTGRRAVPVVCSGCDTRVDDDRVLAGTMARVPYSSHSNFEELRAFVETVGPRNVVRTAETAGYDVGDGRNRNPAFWFDAERRQAVIGARKRAAPKAVHCTGRAVFAKVSGVTRASGVEFGDKSGAKRARVETRRWRCA